MPKISTKGLEMPQSPIRKLVPFSEAAKAAGKHVFHLNIGQPDIASPKVAIDAVKNSGGFGIKITELKEQKDKINVIVKRTGPKKSTDMVTMIITQPINIVKIKKTSKGIFFVEQ